MFLGETLDEMFPQVSLDVNFEPLSVLPTRSRPLIFVPTPPSPLPHLDWRRQATVLLASGLLPVHATLPAQHQVHATTTTGGRAALSRSSTVVALRDQRADDGQSREAREIVLGVHQEQD